MKVRLERRMPTGEEKHRNLFLVGDDGAEIDALSLFGYGDPNNPADKRFPQRLSQFLPHWRRAGHQRITGRSVAFGEWMAMSYFEFDPKANDGKGRIQLEVWANLHRDFRVSGGWGMISESNDGDDWSEPEFAKRGEFRLLPPRFRVGEVTTGVIVSKDEMWPATFAIPKAGEIDIQPLWTYFGDKGLVATGKVGENGKNEDEAEAVICGRNYIFKRRKGDSEFGEMAHVVTVDGDLVRFLGDKLDGETRRPRYTARMAKAEAHDPKFWGRMYLFLTGKEWVTSEMAFQRAGTDATPPAPTPEPPK